MVSIFPVFSLIFLRSFGVEGDAMGISKSPVLLLFGIRLGLPFQKESGIGLESDAACVVFAM